MATTASDIGSIRNYTRSTKKIKDASAIARWAASIAWATRFPGAISMRIPGRISQMRQCRPSCGASVPESLEPWCGFSWCVNRFRNVTALQEWTSLCRAVWPGRCTTLQLGCQLLHLMIAMGAKWLSSFIHSHFRSPFRHHFFMLSFFHLLVHLFAVSITDLHSRSLNHALTRSILS